MRVLFAHPFSIADSALEQELMTPYPPLGLLTLAGVARSAGHIVRAFDGTFDALGARDARFEADLGDFKPDVVCIGAMVTLRPAALAMAAAANRNGAAVIAGGPDPSNAPDVYLDSGHVDTVVVGEAEGLLRGLLDDFAARERPTTVTPRTDQIVENLDTLPVAARDLVDIPAYLAAWRAAHGYTSLTLAVGRGCAWSCGECAEGGRRHFRLRSPASVAAEMRDMALTWAPDRFRIVDELAALDAVWLAALDEAMDAAGVETGFEGLRPSPNVTVRHFAPVMDLCGSRSARIPVRGPHAAPVATADEVYRLWSLMPEGATADP